MQKISPFLWFDDQAEEAAALYTSVFGGAVTGVHRTPDGKVMSVTFLLDEQEFQALNGGPQYKLTPAFSLFVRCEDQAEVDHLWNTLTEGGQEQPCGWLVDRFGLSWQIIPKRLSELLADPDPERAQRALEAMLQMKKIDVRALEDAADGR